ncbi:shootin-1 isoform X1, partial [Tachysurus ichikawai]
MVLKEVNSMQENLEVEKICRQTVEAMATKLNRQNRSLKRKSMMYMAHLDANVIAEINLNDDMDEENHKEAEPGTCNSSHCRLVLSELRNKLESALEEKKLLAIDLETTRDQLHKTREE